MTDRTPESIAGYRIDRVLGRGGMGVVYAAWHPRLPRLDALKVMPATISHDPAFRARFIREAELAARLEHPNIVAIYDCGDDDGLLWLSMRLVRGVTAAQALRRRPSGLPTAEVVRIAAEIGAALDHAHGKGLMHRDVKPANILLDAEGDAARAVLADFGVARAADDTSLTASGLVVGTVDFCSPEQLTAADLDGRADQYSLACTVVHLLTGERPFEGSTAASVIAKHLSSPPPLVSERRAGLPRAVDDVIVRAMAKNRDQRFGSCRAFAAAFADAVAGRDTTVVRRAQPTGVAPRDSATTGIRPATQPHPGAAPWHPGLQRHDVPQPAMTPLPAVTRRGDSSPSGPPYSSPGARMVSDAAAPTAPRRRMPLIAGAVAALVAIGSVGAWALANGEDSAGAAVDHPTSTAPVSTPGASTDVTTARPGTTSDQPVPTATPRVSRARVSIVDGDRLDPCRIPAGMLEDGTLVGAVTRTARTSNMTHCVGHLGDKPAIDVLLGGFARGSNHEAVMLANWNSGVALPGRAGWRKYDYAGSDGMTWCKVGYRSVNPTYTFEVAAVRDPRERPPIERVPMSAADRRLVCDRLPQIAAGIDAAMPASG